MKYRNFLCLALLLCIVGFPVLAGKCGCKTLTPCYAYMLEVLQEQDEAYCIEDAAIGTSTLMVFLKALQDFCGEFVKVDMMPKQVTYDLRHLYEVVIHNEHEEKNSKEPIPVIVIDAGQEAGTESVSFALHIIEQLVACDENAEMIQNVKWVIMPSTNPDGMEYASFRQSEWRKNLNLAKDEVSFGVDISRNFDEQWGQCPKVLHGFSQIFPGPYAGSEAETTFIKTVLNKYLRDAKLYLSLRKDGHHIAYPYAYSNNEPANLKQLQHIAAQVASKVNMRSGGVHIFANNSIYNMQMKAHCGHSVDYAIVLGIPYCFEMRIFLRTNNQIMSKFQTMPRGYKSSLLNGYMAGIREFYNVFTNKKKYGNLTKY